MAKPRCIFVYGTLMPASIGVMGFGPRARLAAESSPLAPATVVGLIYDLGSYPGLVLPVSPAGVQVRCGTNADVSRVHGEVLELKDPVRTFAWLDRYEGIAPGAPRCEYRRDVLQAELSGRAQGPQTIDAWVYVYQGPLNRARMVKNGRWRA